MKTVNLSIPEDVWQQARIEAAKHNTSLSGLVRSYLKAMVQGKAPVLYSEDLSHGQEYGGVQVLNPFAKN